MESHCYQFIPKEDRPANPPDVSPMDYGISGIFKRRLLMKKTTTLLGLIRAMKNDWSNMSKKLCVNVFESSENCVRILQENNGYQIEDLL